MIGKFLSACSIHDWFGQQVGDRGAPHTLQIFFLVFGLIWHDEIGSGLKFCDWFKKTDRQVIFKQMTE